MRIATPTVPPNLLALYRAAIRIGNLFPVGTNYANRPHHKRSDPFGFQKDETLLHALDIAWDLSQFGSKSLTRRARFDLTFKIATDMMAGVFDSAIWTPAYKYDERIRNWDTIAEQHTDRGGDGASKSTPYKNVTTFPGTYKDYAPGETRDYFYRPDYVNLQYEGQKKAGTHQILFPYSDDGLSDWHINQLHYAIQSTRWLIPFPYTYGKNPLNPRHHYKDTNHLWLSGTMHIDLMTLQDGMPEFKRWMTYLAVTPEIMSSYNLSWYWDDPTQWGRVQMFMPSTGWETDFENHRIFNDFEWAFHVNRGARYSTATSRFMQWVQLNIAPTSSRCRYSPVSQAWESSLNYTLNLYQANRTPF